MKKIIGIFVIVLIVMCMANNTIAAMQCNIVLSPEDTAEITTNDEFKVDVKVSEIFSDRGLVAFGAILDYDKKSLKLEKMEGVGDYSTPAYNEKNGKILIERNPTNHNATMFTLTFKVLNTDNVKVTMKDITVSDGTGLGKVGTQSYTPQIKAEVTPTPTPGTTVTPTPNPTEKPDNNQGGNNQGSDNSGDTTTKKDDKLPQTGLNSLKIPGMILGVIVILGVSYKKYKDMSIILR